MYIGIYRALNKIPRMGSLSGYIIDLVQLFSYLGSDFDSDFMNFALAIIFLFIFCGAKANMKFSFYYRF